MNALLTSACLDQVYCLKVLGDILPSFHYCLWMSSFLLAVCLSVCVFIYLVFCLFVKLSVFCTFVGLSIFLIIFLSILNQQVFVCLIFLSFFSVCLFAQFCFYLCFSYVSQRFIYVSVCPCLLIRFFVCLSNCPFICFHMLPVCIIFCLSVCLFFCLYVELNTLGDK